MVPTTKIIATKDHNLSIFLFRPLNFVNFHVLYIFIFLLPGNRSFFTNHFWIDKTYCSQWVGPTKATKVLFKTLVLGVLHKILDMVFEFGPFDLYHLFFFLTI